MIFPKAKSLSQENGIFNISLSVNISYSENFKGAAEFLSAQFSNIYGINCKTGMD